MTRLWSQIRDWVFLVVFVAISIVVLFAQNQPLVRGLRASALESTSLVEGTFAWMGRYFRALDENTDLRAENVRLAGEVARSREAVLANERLEALLALEDTSDLPLLAARILTKDITRARNYFTLDVGRNDSVKIGQAVIDDRGILGRVVLVSDDYAKVMPYLNTDFRVPAKIQELQVSGIVRWEGEQIDRLLMEQVVKSAPVQPGQLVVTSGFSALFPAGYPIGVVDTLAARPGRNEFYVYLTPSARLADAQYAFVVLTTPDPQRLELEAASLP